MTARDWTWAGAILGFALGGFFDGILLHQILQWHHLLSLVPGIGELRAQVMWDGVFHALMYVIAAWELVALWRAHRREAAVPRGIIVGALLVGFGTWHVIDTLLSHWFLGIHRIRIDSPNPLAWDLLWTIGKVAAFMVLMMVVGRRAVPWILARSAATGSRPAACTSRSWRRMTAVSTPRRRWVGETVTQVTPAVGTTAPGTLISRL